MATTTKRADFEAVWPGLAQDILAHAKKYNLPQNALEWFEKVGYAPHPEIEPNSTIDLQLTNFLPLIVSQC